MPSRTEATRAKAALCATGRLTPLRLFSTLPFCSPKSGSVSAMAIFRQSTICLGAAFAFYFICFSNFFTKRSPTLSKPVSSPPH